MDDCRLQGSVDPLAHPIVSAFVDFAGPGKLEDSYLAQVTTWFYGDQFLRALEENLAAAQHVFKSDGNAQAHFLSTDRNQFLQVMGEIWIAAHFVRHGFRIHREGATGPSPDFHFVHAESGTRGRVEVKKVDYEEKDVVPAQSGWGFVPTTLADTSDFLVQAGRKIRAARGQLSADAAEVRILAVDFTASHTHERVLSPMPSEDASATLEWVRRGLHERDLAGTVDSLICFCIGLDRAQLAVLRYFPLRDDLPPPFAART